MCELGFRVWDETRRKYLPSCQILIDDRGNLLRLLESDNNCIIGTVCRIGCLKCDRKPKLIIEQSTGLTDKDGIGIYEGDVVRYGDNIGNVFYDNDTACFNVSGFYNGYQDYPSLAFSENGNATMEVVGNIHENPELSEGVN